MDFNSYPGTTMHIDINSCFATIEQQANPFLRDKFVVVAAYTTGNGCILAASYNAKKLGVKTGMRVKDAKALCPALVALSPDPDKYRFVHKKMRVILNKYSPYVFPKSIDEFVLTIPLKNQKPFDVALEIKEKIKKEIGEFITVSIGISTNRFLAKTASSLKKPDGLSEINKNNYLEVFEKLKLTDLCGIKKANAYRLASVGINSVLEFYHADIPKLKLGFRSITGYYWYLRLHGYEVNQNDNVRKSFGNTYSLPAMVTSALPAGLPSLQAILTKLIEKMSARLRKKNYIAQGIHLGILFRDHSYWHKGKKLMHPIFASQDFYKEFLKLLNLCELKPVKNIAVTCFDLKPNNFSQLDMTYDVTKKENLVKALDKINAKFGNFTITSARIINNEKYVLDRIAFGGMSEI